MPESESNNKNNSVAGTSIGTIIQTVFIILKVAKVMPFKNWHWWMVFLPMEIGAGFCVLVVFCYCGVGACVICRQKNEEVGTHEDYTADLTDDVFSSQSATERPSVTDRNSLVQTV